MPKLGETITLDFGTYSPTTGASASADSTPSVYVFEEATDTAILTPTPVERTGYAGVYRVQVVCSAGNGFEAGKSYSVMASAVVGGVTARVPLTSFQVRTYSSDDVYTVVPSAASNASAVRTELSTELGRIDASVSTRATPTQVNAECDTAIADASLATAASIAAIPTASANAAEVRTELTTELGRIDAAISTRATPAQVNSECDTAISDASLATAASIAALSIPTASANASAVRTNLTTELGLITTNLDAKVSEVSGGGGTPAPGEVTYSDSVEDGSGNPQAGVTITIAEDESGEVTVARTTTAADGTWSVNLVPGTYYAIASKAGWYRVVSAITVEEP